MFFGPGRVRQIHYVYVPLLPLIEKRQGYATDSVCNEIRQIPVFLKPRTSHKIITYTYAFWGSDLCEILGTGTPADAAMASRRLRYVL